MSHTKGKLIADALNITINEVQRLYYCIGQVGTKNVIAITGEVGDGQDELTIADTRRLVACWNACDGVPSEGLEMYDMKNIELKQERDELISWLAVCDDLLKEYAPKYDGCSTEERIAEILARYKTK